jgi:hypothetical protein
MTDIEEAELEAALFAPEAAADLHAGQRTMPQDYRLIRYSHTKNVDIDVRTSICLASQKIAVVG